jgi:hypothetical protein
VSGDYLALAVSLKEEAMRKRMRASANRLRRALMILSALIAGGSTWPAMAQPERFSAGEVARRAVERRAVEAVIWGMPAVN